MGRGGGGGNGVWPVCGMHRWCCEGGVWGRVCGGRVGVWCGCGVYRCHVRPCGRHGCVPVGAGGLMLGKIDGKRRRG